MGRRWVVMAPLCRESSGPLGGAPPPWAGPWRLGLRWVGLGPPFSVMSGTFPPPPPYVLCMSCGSGLLMSPLVFWSNLILFLGNSFSADNA